jgi:hypothetical protein
MDIDGFMIFLEVYLQLELVGHIKEGSERNNRIGKEKPSAESISS